MANGQIKCYRVAKNMRLSGQIEMRFTGQIHAITHQDTLHMQRCNKRSLRIGEKASTVEAKIPAKSIK